ncbi:hypothetical protein TrLO_g11383 [Triparma laevis f. longispina]|uniref:Uncharacterized protein n=1 Tax=Triparma laevis f. longispina TaxID=1714387 RepID=A0A9W7F294_9STRA|nr:hypothetical protein TrLO_g11383 [Triparma laevis f. longispina]
MLDRCELKQALRNKSSTHDHASQPESLPISTRWVMYVPAATDQFMFTDDFKRLLVGFVPGDTLMTLRLTTKAWKRVVDAFIDEGVRNGTIIVHGGKDIGPMRVPRADRRAFATRVIFLLNIMKVGARACWASNLVVVDISEGIESIG